MIPSSSASPVRRLLIPFVPLYRLGLALREGRLRSGKEQIHKLAWPVVSIGNLSTGGAGKTPLTIALASVLAARGVHVDVLSRGYGRGSRGVARVSLNGTAEQFGDEPLLIAREAGVPVYVAAERYDAGRLAEHERGAASDAAPGAKLRPGVHLLDDGFQHRQLARDLDVVLLNSRDRRDRLLPAGNLREPLRALGRAHVIAVLAGEPEVEEDLHAWGWGGPVWRLRRRMETPQVDGPVVAFCGIARPEPFFAGLEASGLHLAARVAFRDHYPYTERDLDRLAQEARALGAVAFVTTEKDRARLGALPDAAKGLPALLTARLRVEIEDEDAVIDWLLDQLRDRLNPEP